MALPNQYHQHPDSVLLTLEIPRTNDKKELSAEQMLAALHGILRSKKELKGKRQEHLSLEMASIGQRIRFYMWMPRELQAFVEGQIYAQYPNVHIQEGAEDYAARDMMQPVIYTTELALVEHETLPIKTFPSFEVDPLASITATLAKLDRQDEEMWVQIIARPINDDWHKLGAKRVARIKSGGGLFNGAGGASLSYFGQALAALVTPPGENAGKSSEPEISERDKTRITAIQEKGVKLGYQVKVRVLYAGPDEITAQSRMQAIVGAFKQFNTTNLNGFTSTNASFNRERLTDYRNRHFIDKGFILNIEELASLFHLPHTSVETPNIVWANTKTAELPSNVPTRELYADDELSLFGVSNFRGTNTIFGASRSDRSRHMYIIGQTGTGKSGLLELLTLSDIFYGEGLAVVDPHGDYAQDMLSYIPESRLDDVIYFNPLDAAHPIGFNPLEVTDPAFKTHVASEIVGVLKRMFGDSWGPRLEYILRYTLLALLDYPNTTMLDIPRMLTEKPFRNEVMKHVEDPVVRNFWFVEFASWNDKFASEAVAPVLNKVGAFTATPTIRNIIGQPKSTFNIRQIMDEGKILLVNLSKGQIGEDNASILGALLVTKIQLAAMSRANVDKSQRRPFYLYVDEFQNYATDSFAVILSEARKYGLNLTVANQYISQMIDTVRGAVFGNVGSVISFRVSPEDAPFLVKYFEPQFEAQDLTLLNNRHFLCTMTIKGEKSSPFSGTTLNLPPPAANFSDQIIQLSRERYAGNREAVEQHIRETSLSASASGANQRQDSGQKPYTITPGKKDNKGPAGQAKPGGQAKPNKSAPKAEKPAPTAPKAHAPQEATTPPASTKAATATPLDRPAQPALTAQPLPQAAPSRSVTPAATAANVESPRPKQRSPIAFVVQQAINAVTPPPAQEGTAKPPIPMPSDTNIKRTSAPTADSSPAAQPKSTPQTPPTPTGTEGESKPKRKRTRSRRKKKSGAANTGTAPAAPADSSTRPAGRAAAKQADRSATEAKRTPQPAVQAQPAAQRQQTQAVKSASKAAPSSASVPKSKNQPLHGHFQEDTVIKLR